MAKLRTTPIRSHPDMQKLIKQVMGEKMVKQKRMVTTSRITLAIANQYKKYPLLFKELMDADLK